MSVVNAEKGPWVLIRGPFLLWNNFMFLWRVVLSVVSLLGACQGFAEVKIAKLWERDIDDYKGCSGITYAGGDSYYVVQDHDDDGWPKLYPVTISVSESGTFKSLTFSAGLKLADTGDAEGVAFDPGSKGVWVSDESTPPKISEFMPILAAEKLTPVRSAAVPKIYAKCRANCMLEALTISPNGLEMWTSNEEALTEDGADSTTSGGPTVVRLTRFTRRGPSDDWTSDGQWAYRCLPTGAGLVKKKQQSGLSGLCALPDGSLLVLEREVSVDTRGRLTIFRLPKSAFTKEKDISSLTGLQNASYSAVEKGDALYTLKGKGFLLDFTQMICYEGICLGPKLNDGSWLLLLVSDGQSQTMEALGISVSAATVSRVLALGITGISEPVVPSIPWEQGSLTVMGSVGTVELAPGSFRVAVENGSELTQLVVPPQTAWVSGISKERIAVKAGDLDLTAAFALSADGQGVAINLDPNAVVSVGDERIPVTPTLVTEGQRGFVLEAEGVSLRVKSIPNLFYALISSESLEMSSGKWSSIGSPVKASETELDFSHSPAGAMPQRAYYRIRVSARSDEMR